MSIVTHLQEPVSYELRAKQEAGNAAMAAREGYQAKLDYNLADEIVRQWRNLMINAPVSMHNILFIIFLVVEILLSYEVYRSILQDIGFPYGLITLGVLTVALLVSGWAAATAHFIGKGWSKDIQTWERWNYVFLANKNNLTALSVDMHMAQETKRARRLAITSGFVLFALVLLSVGYRTIVLKEMAGNDSAINQAQLWILAALPIIILIGELYTGDFIWYSMSLSSQKRRRRRFYRNFIGAKKACNDKDQLAMDYVRTAASRGVQVDISGDLQNSHMRLTQRSVQSDDYLDPFEKDRSVQFNFRDSRTREPLRRYKVKGVLPNNVSTSEFETDGDGQVIVRWEGNHNHLKTVFFDDTRQWFGPFHAGGTHNIDVVSHTSGGNGQPTASPPVSVITP